MLAFILSNDAYRTEVEVPLNLDWIRWSLHGNIQHWIRLFSDPVIDRKIAAQYCTVPTNEGYKTFSAVEVI